MYFSEKRIICILILVSVLISLSTISAADNSTIEDLSTADGDELISTDVSLDENLGQGEVKNFTQLNAEIQSGGNQIKLEGNYIYNSSEDSSYVNGIQLSKSNLVIDGQGKTIINGSNQARIFDINKDVSNITIKNIVFVNANSNDADGVISFLGNNKQIIINATFKENMAYGHRGIISFLGTSSDILIDGVFEVNGVETIASESGVIYFYSTSNVEISGSWCDFL